MFKLTGIQSLDADSSLADVQQLTISFLRDLSAQKKAVIWGIFIISPYSITAVANEDVKHSSRGTFMKQISVS